MKAHTKPDGTTDLKGLTPEEMFIILQSVKLYNQKNNFPEDVTAIEDEITAAWQNPY